MSKLGISGGIAERFQSTQITPLLALVGLLLGLFMLLAGLAVLAWPLASRGRRRAAGASSATG